MFNKKKDNETDFCESYKSEILGSKEDEKGTSFFSTIIKLLTILLLLAIIVGVSFYGYNYFLNNQKFQSKVLPPISLQVTEEESVSDDKLVVEVEEPKIEKTVEKENISIPSIVSPQVEEEIDQIANEVKIAIAKSELEEENETKREEKAGEALTNTDTVESLEVPTSAPEAKYLEDLADLSKEIDKERNQ